MSEEDKWTDYDGDEAKSELLTRLIDAPTAACTDVGGYDATKMSDGRWVIEPDEEVGAHAGVFTSAELLDNVCCYHPAHWPVNEPRKSAAISVDALLGEHEGTNH